MYPTFRLVPGRRLWSLSPLANYFMEKKRRSHYPFPTPLWAISRGGLERLTSLTHGKKRDSYYFSRWGEDRCPSL
jgi:hypothetical protein